MPCIESEMLFKKLVQLVIEFDESLIFKLQSGFGESSFGHNAFDGVGSAQDIEKTIEFILIRAAKKTEKKSDQCVSRKFSFAREVGWFLPVALDEIRRIDNLFNKFK